MKIRAASWADLDAIAAVERAAMPGGWSRQQIAEELGRELGRTLVAELDGAVVGHAIGSFVAGEAEVLELAVHPAVRRRGLGRALLRALIDACGCPVVHLEVRGGNDSAVALYEAEGFRRVGRRRAYYADGEDALLMTLRREEAAGAQPPDLST